MGPQSTLTHTLDALSPEDLEAFNKELQAMLDAKSFHLIARPVIADDGRIMAKIMVFKKVELASSDPTSKVDGADSQENGEKNG